ncbi:bifunctional bis(5'-adenosyl)-triphosphatase/adenylylsulfatase FHIT-like isoform X2 [Beta vulgaris subsp. vulgaris]|nr:bifunctional bis(5'-adenosyl)-triphosphatase/adenylylsulfatase FHIT-like isoform X2 [Beta vulgaris subsp. vulgaris]
MELDSFTFGFYKIDAEEVFYSTNLSFAMVNLRCLLPVRRFADLTANETCDIWLTPQKAGRQLEDYHKASSLTLVIQSYGVSQSAQKLDLDKERKDKTLLKR